MHSCQVPDKEGRMEQWITAYGDSLLRLCFLYLHDVYLAEDALQSTFLAAWRALDRFRGEASEKTWLTRIAINSCKSIARTAWFHHVDINAALDTIPCDRDLYDRTDDTVLQKVMALPIKYREVILLYYYQNLKTREIADVLQVPEATVSTRLKRAKEKLRPQLERWYFDEKQ